MSNELSSDKQTIEEVLNGQTAAFEILVRKYQDRLFNTLAHVLADKHDAEEVVQDAMLQAYSKLATFRGASSFYTWLYRIAFNMAMSRQRKKRPRVSLNEMHDSQGLDPTSDGDSPNDAIERNERAGQIHKALEKLSDEFRSVLVLREMEDCDYETISQMLDVPIGTVRSRLSRGRTMLRDLLRDSIGELDTP